MHKALAVLKAQPVRRRLARWLCGGCSELFGYVEKLFRFSTPCTMDFVNGNWKTNYWEKLLLFTHFQTAITYNKSNAKHVRSLAQG